MAKFLSNFLKKKKKFTTLYDITSQLQTKCPFVSFYWGSLALIALGNTLKLGKYANQIFPANTNVYGSY